MRPTRAVINTKQLLKNFNAIKKHAKNTTVMPILKANAYGHGMLEIAKILEKEGAKIFGLAFLEEGILLRKNKIKADILILGGLSGYQVDLFIKYNLIITASSIDKLTIIDERAKELKQKARVHLKIDTGMERVGVHHYNARAFFKEALKKENIIIEGVYSHFASSDDKDSSFTFKQFEYFKNAIKYFDEKNYKLIKHISNSGAFLQFKEMNLDMVRIGISLYGYMPSVHVKNILNLKPVLSLKSKVVFFKVIEKNATISYGRTYKSKKQTRIITVPIGYGDGYPRALSNKGEVIIKGKKFPIVGRICMDQIMVDIGNSEAYNQDEVVLIGEEGSEKIDCDDIAKIADTISYEILTMINTRIPRIYV